MVWHPYHVFIMTICTAMVGEKWTSWYVALIFATTRTAMDLVAGVKKTVQGTQNENITHTCLCFQHYGTKKVMLHRFC